MLAGRDKLGPHGRGAAGPRQPSRSLKLLRRVYHETGGSAEKNEFEIPAFTFDKVSSTLGILSHKMLIRNPACLPSAASIPGLGGGSSAGAKSAEMY